MGPPRLWRFGGALLCALPNFTGVDADTATGMVLTSTMTLSVDASANLCTKQVMETLSAAIAEGAAKCTAEPIDLHADNITGLSLSGCGLSLDTTQTTTPLPTVAANGSRKLSPRRLAQHITVQYSVITKDQNAMSNLQQVAGSTSGSGTTQNLADAVKKAFNAASSNPQIQQVITKAFSNGCTVNAATPPAATLAVPCAEGHYIPDNGVCTVMCNPGYSPASQPTLTCNAGTLPAPACVPAACTPKPVANGTSYVCKELKGQENIPLQHEDICTPVCDPLFEPTQKSVKCLLGEVGAFKCEPAPCDAPKSLVHADPKGACKEGATVKSGSTCTPQCEAKYAPNVTAPKCTVGKLEPFLCRFMDCAAPTQVNFAALPSCKEGNVINNGTNCTPACAAGYTPSFKTLDCLNGIFTQASTFVCQPPTTTTQPQAVSRVAKKSPQVSVRGSSASSSSLPLKTPLLAGLIGISAGLVGVVVLIRQLLAARAKIEAHDNASMALE